MTSARLILTRPLSVALAWCGLLVVLVGIAVTPVEASAADTQVVTYGGYSITVPTSWPVYHLSSDPTQCVRFDVHAVYVGQPGSDQNCPPNAQGVTEAILLAPASSGDAGAPGVQGVVPAGSTAPTSWPAASAGGVHYVVPGTGVEVAATWLHHPEAIQQILGGAVVTPGPAPSSSPAVKAAGPSAAAPHVEQSAAQFQGLGFDACTAPSTSAMSAWLSSPYRAVAVYIGGVNRGCAQPNLTSAWVTAEVKAGWQLIPTYVGPQAPSDGADYNTINPSSATSEGLAAATDAVNQMQALGLGQGNTIYYDMESYPPGPTTSPTVLTFLSAWTTALHFYGFQSGVYSSASTGIADLVKAVGGSYQLPDDIWIADWDNQQTTSDPYVPPGEWADGQRIRQYSGPNEETWGGVTIDIDNDDVNGGVGSTPAPLAYPANTYGPGGVPGFTITGSTWYSGAPYGLEHDELWSASHGSTASDTATWAPHLAAGQFNVQAYVPNVNNANVTYEITDATGTHAVPIDQGSHANQWVLLGAFTASAAQSISVTLGNNSSDPVGGTSVGADAMQFDPVVVGGPYSSLPSPVRICDTRAGNPSMLSASPQNQCNGDTVAGGTSRTIIAAGQFGVPSTATAVVVNVTVVNPQGTGYLTAYPTGARPPTASNLNYSPGVIVPNLIEVGTGTDGEISLYSSVTTDVVVDLEGYVSPAAPGGAGSGLYVPLSPPARICDTRTGNPSSLTGGADQCNGLNGAGSTLSAGETISVQVSGNATVPSGATAAVLNVTAVHPASSGYLTVFAGGSSPPVASNVNYWVDQTRSNRVIVPLSGAGAISIFSFAATDVVVDVSGYFTAMGGTGTSFHAEPTPVRICDTRPGNPSGLGAGVNQCNGRPLGSRQTVNLNVVALAGIPADADAVVVNVTGLNATAPTYLTVFPGGSPPLVSDLNPQPGLVSANLVEAALNAKGTLSIYNSVGSLDMVVDVLGWYS